MTAGTASADTILKDRAEGETEGGRESIIPIVTKD